MIGNGNPETAKPYFGVDEVIVSEVPEDPDDPDYPVVPVDPNNPPETLRGTVLKDGQIRTFNLERVSYRGADFEVVLLDTDGVSHANVRSTTQRRGRMTKPMI